MANPKTATFASAGKISQHTIPGAYSRFTSAQGRAGLASASNGLIVGSSGGGEPKTALWFSSYAEAKAALRDGSALPCIKEAFDPGHDLSPQRIGFMRVDPALQSTLTMLNDPLGAMTAVVLATSVDWGLWTSQIWLQLSDGVTTGSKVFAMKSGTEVLTSKDLVKASLSVSYTGAGAVAAVTIAADSFDIVTDVPADDISLDLTEYTTIQSIVDALNATGVYTATLITSNGEELTSQLDFVTGVTIVSPLAPVFYSNLQALIDGVNALSGFVTLAHIDGADRLVPDNFVWTKMAGGTNGTKATQDWTDCLTTLESEDIQFLGTDTATEAISTLVGAHLTRMNGVEGKKERQAFIGGLTSLANTQTFAKATNNYALCLAWMEFTNYNDAGVLTSYGSVQYAAKLLGQACSVNINEPLTFKTVKVIECQTKLTKTQKEDAILAGVIVPEVTANGTVRTVRQVTTYQGNDLKLCEFSMVREQLYFSRDLRTLMEDTFIGQAGVGNRLTAVESLGKARLNEYEKSLQIIVADPNNPKGNPAWKDFVWSVSGATIRITVKANIVAPINFIFQTHEFDILATV